MSDRKKRSSSRGTVTWREEDHASPPARRSQRNSASLKKSLNKSSASLVPIPITKRSITAKKIMPRKTLAALAFAESQPSASSGTTQPSNESTAPQSTPKVANITAVRRSSRVSPNLGKENSILEKSQVVPKGVTDQPTASKIDILSPIPLNIPQSPTFDREKVMSQKVRRSYSRLEMSLNGSSLLYSPTRNTDSSDTSTPNFVKNPGRRSLFGFDKLLSSETQEEEKASHKTVDETRHTNNGSSSGTSIRMSVEEPDLNIPGVLLVKQKRRKHKIPQLKKSELDDWAATMNAEFEEAEKFDLLVE